ncbi:hypothetical protein NE237_009066 [Protea cynaroides]|uniref:glutathione transferase n=1 Tax=Protea cynaroides TaxID=273540 RepID=A0A9Q0KXM1_9MAGN|nr:hypothetical protein NE237_009066 [Protea cynaroides]
MTIFENKFKGRKFFGGDSIGLVDIAANGVLEDVAELTKDSELNETSGGVPAEEVEDLLDARLSAFTPLCKLGSTQGASRANDHSSQDNHSGCPEREHGKHNSASQERRRSAAWKAFWDEGKEQEKSMEEAQELLGKLELELQGKKFFGGDSIGFVDITANFIAFWVGVLEDVMEVKLIDEKKFPNLCKWTEEFLSVELVKECLPAREKLSAYFQSRKEAMAASKS